MEALLGLFWLCLFIGTPIAIGWYVAVKHGPRIEAKKRDRQIETAMRLGLRDAEAQAQIAEKLRQERGY
jgi:hypothetical protein